MKTSNIILLILFICIPVFSFTYNWLLKERFLSGNFTPSKFDPDINKIKKELPSFQHLVIDGVLKGKNRNVESIQIPWLVSSNGNHKTTEIKYPKEWQDIVHTSVRNDTLFVSLEKDKVSETIADQLLRRPREIELTLPSIYSFTLINGKGHFKGINVTNEVKLIVKDHASIAVNSTYLPEIEIVLKDDSTIKFEEKNQINRLEYSLYDQAFLSISDQTHIEQLHSVRVDSLSKISITARAKELQKQIVKVVEGGE